MIFTGLNTGYIARDCKDFNLSNSIFDKVEDSYKYDVDLQSLSKKSTRALASTLINEGVNDYQGATTSAAGVAGLVPAASTGDTSKFLRSDGSWATVTSAQGYMKLDGSTPMEGDLDVSNHVIKNVADPTSDNHAATKGYVDNAVSNVSITCDTTLDAASTNPVTNAAITARINELATQITNLTNTVNSKLASTAKITLTGDVSGTGTFSNNAVSITTTVADDSHNHTIANIDNLQTTLNSIQSTANTANSNASSAKTVTDKYATMLNIIGNNQ